MSPTEDERIEIVEIAEDDAGERLDKILPRYAPQHSRSQIQRFIDEGRITQRGETISRKSRAIAGAEIEIRPSPPAPFLLVPEDIPIEILHEDPSLLIVEKPAGMVVHPSKGHASGTLVHAILGKLRELSGDSEERPGIVHRLDKDTSGLMIIARTIAAHEALAKLFKAQAVEREYHAIALDFDEESRRFETFHARHPHDRKRFTSRATSGKIAITEVKRIEPLHGGSLVECRLQTGRTHQIRVHLSDAGFPLLGDPLYGKSISDPSLRAIGQELGRQALHARALAFDHPITGERLRFMSEPPADFMAALKALRR